MVICTFLDNIDVEHLKQESNTEYYPKRFPRFVFRIPSPRSTMLLFKTDKVICTGVKEEDNAIKAIKIFFKGFKLDQQLKNRRTESSHISGFQVQEQFMNLILISDKSICVSTEDLADVFKKSVLFRKNDDGIEK